jgi:uncharacterized protein YxeA
MLDKEKKDKIFRISILVICIALVILSGVILKNSNKCSSNPFIYGASKVYEQSQEKLEVSCSCSFNDQEYKPFFFNKDGVVYSNYG